MDRYIVFDVETPNFTNERMSAIGITVVENMAVAGEFYSLVDPEQGFDRFNMELTGITPEQVRGQPAFPELWERIGPLMDSGLLVAHNAPFDMSVLAKCLRGYGLSWRSEVSYACTCRLSRRALPGLPNHRLDTLSAYLGLELEHHRAMSDSRACAEILLHCLRLGVELGPLVSRYDMLNIRTVRPGGRTARGYGR